MVKLNKSIFFIKKNNKNYTNLKKNQIILVNTAYEINYFINKIINQYTNNQIIKTPTFSIDIDGNIYQHYDPEITKVNFLDNIFDDTAIVIALENVGWLNLNKKTKKFFDWKGSLYNNNVIEKSWRGKKYWANYTTQQFNALIELIDYLCIEYSIKKRFIGDNTFNPDILKFDGIINRSNFSKNHYDLSPAFNFEELKKIINTQK
jgi:hypothetical protein